MALMDDRFKQFYNDPDIVAFRSRKFDWKPIIENWEKAYAEMRKDRSTDGTVPPPTESS